MWKPSTTFLIISTWKQRFTQEIQWRRSNLQRNFMQLWLRKTLGLVLCCSLLSSLSLCSLSYSSRISAGVRFLSTTCTAIITIRCWLWRYCMLPNTVYDVEAKTPDWQRVCVRNKNVPPSLPLPALSSQRYHRWLSSEHHSALRGKMFCLFVFKCYCLFAVFTS